jgi:hypothetical protein
MKIALVLLVLISSPAFSNDAPPMRPVLHGGEVPIGRLGYPLGSYLTIEGVRADGLKTGIRTLIVDTINGKRLDKPIEMWIDNADLPPKFRCTIKGYEAIRMLGVPPATIVAAKEAGKNVGLPQAGWQVQLYFAALSDIALKNAALKRDPVAAIRSALPQGWAILKVEENAFPADLPNGKGKAILLGRGGEETDAIVYIMPADYQDGGEHLKSKLSRTIPAKLIATVPTAKIYLWERFGQLSAPGWPGMWDDVPKSLLTQE